MTEVDERATARQSERSSALAELYAAHYEFVWRSARRLGAPEGSVDDAVQEVFLVVARRLADFEGRSSIRTWLFGITMRVVSSLRRRDSRHRRRVDAVASDPTPPPDDLGHKHDAVRLLDRLLGELDEDKRAVFILVELEGMTAGEIAEALGVKTNTVYSRLRLARAALERAARRERARDRSQG